MYSILSHMSEPMGLKKDRQIQEKSAWPQVRPSKIQCEKIDRNCALKGSCAYFHGRNRQYDGKEL